MPPKTRSSVKAASKQSPAPAENEAATGEVQLQPSLQSTPTLSKRRKKVPRASGQKMLQSSPDASPDVERIVGAKMSNFKHSGLLERDEKALREVLEEDEIDLGVHSTTRAEVGEGEGESVQQVSGRYIYSIQSVHRSTKKNKQTETTTINELTSATTKTDDYLSQQARSVEVPAMQVKEHAKANKRSGISVDESKKSRRKGKRVEKAPTTDVEGTDCVQVQPETNSARRSLRTSKTSSRMDYCEVEKSSSNSAKKTRKGGVLQWSSDSEQEIDELSDEEEEEEEEKDEEMESIAAQLNRGVMTENALADYFTAHTGKVGVTSDHTLSRLARPRLEQGDVLTALQATSSRFQDDCQKLYQEYNQLYSYWLLQMHSGFNILLYGLGAKKRLMEDFSKKCLSQSCHLVVNGYFPGLTVKQVLSSLSSDLLGHSGSFKSHTEHAQFVTNTLDNKSSKKDIPQEVFLIIHNLDGPMLRNERAQAALSILAVSKNIHVIASVDHINAALLCDQTKLSRFNWTWHDVTTFEAYREETSYENSLLIQQSGSLALSSLHHVMKSLTPNARGIFELLARYQLENKKGAEKSYQGLSFGECYRRCREKFLVNSDLTLRAQLTEFRDHKLVRSNKGNDGVEYLLIPVDDATLSQFLSEFID